MEQIRAWVLTICFACIAAGILGQLSSSRTRFSVIKLILTLYILITAFAPLPSLGEGRMMIDIPEPPQTMQAPNTETLVLNTACGQLEDAVQSALSQGGIACSEVGVTLDSDSGSVEVTSVAVTVPCNTDVSSVDNIIAKALGIDVPVTISEEG